MFIVANGRAIEIDEAGFLVDSSAWSEEVAREMAKSDGLELASDHWDVIHLVREYYEQHRCAPTARLLAEMACKKFGAEKGNRKYLCKLFPADPEYHAHRYAGLPRDRWPYAGPTIDVAGRCIKVDEEGFLADRRVWNEDVAKELARVLRGVPSLTRGAGADEGDGQGTRPRQGHDDVSPATVSGGDIAADMQARRSPETGLFRRPMNGDVLYSV